MYTSFSDIIGAWPSIEEFSSDANTTPSLAHVWKHRDKIPDDAWEAVAHHAKRRKIKGVTLSLLASLAAKRGRRRRRAA